MTKLQSNLSTSSIFKPIEKSSSNSTENNNRVKLVSQSSTTIPKDINTSLQKALNNLNHGPSVDFTFEPNFDHLNSSFMQNERQPSASSFLAGPGQSNLSINKSGSYMGIYGMNNFNSNLDSAFQRTNSSNKSKDDRFSSALNNN